MPAWLSQKSLGGEATSLVAQIEHQSEVVGPTRHQLGHADPMPFSHLVWPPAGFNALLGRGVVQPADLRPEQGHHLQCRRRRPNEPHGALIAGPAMALQPRQVGRRHLLNMAGGRRRRHCPMFDVASDQISQIRTERSEPNEAEPRVVVDEDVTG